jgi:hypothetical protein
MHFDPPDPKNETSRKSPMKKFHAKILAAAAIAAAMWSGAAMAHVSVGIYAGIPVPAPYYYAPPPVVYAPRPYYAPAPVYIAPSRWERTDWRERREWRQREWRREHWDHRHGHR